MSLIAGGDDFFSNAAFCCKWVDISVGDTKFSLKEKYLFSF